MQVAVLAGGLGTRLRDALPPGTPKPMAEVAGRPFLEHVLDEAISQGADRFLLLVSHGAEVIGRHFGSRTPECRWAIAPSPSRWAPEARCVTRGGSSSRGSS